MRVLPLLAALAGATPVQADLHLDTPTQLHRRGVGLDGPGLEGGLRALQAGGTNLAVMVLWPPRAEGGPAHVRTLWERMEAEDARLAAVRRVESPAEARAVAEAGGVAMIYAVEGAHGLEPGPDGLREAWARGVSMVGLTWSFSNAYAGSSGDGGGGLTEAGRALVAEAQRVGVMIDVSHASPDATRETCALARAPIVASHSNARAVTAHVRNLGDDEIRCIAATGGVIGVNVHGPFVGPSADVARVADHLDHLRAIGGAGVVALGSDWDGIIQPARGLADASGVPVLIEELRRRGWTETEIAGFRGENFLRAWQAALDAADRGESGGP